MNIQLTSVSFKYTNMVSTSPDVFATSPRIVSCMLRIMVDDAPLQLSDGCELC